MALARGVTSPQEWAMAKLFPGTTAPPFDTVDVAGATLTVPSGRPLWLTFYRFASCPLCAMRVHEVTEWLRSNRCEGVDVIAVFPSPPEKVRVIADPGGTPLRVVADPEGGLSERYGTVTSSWGVLSPQAWAAVARARRAGMTDRTHGLEPDGALNRMPAEFLIAPDGTIVEAHYAAHAGEHIPLARVAAFVDRARAAPAR